MNVRVVIGFLVLSIWLSLNLNAQTKFENPPQSEKEFAKWVQKFSDLQESDLERLMKHNDISTALAAAWESVNRGIKANPEKFDQYGVKYQTAWFLGFLEAKTGTRPPVQWIELIKSAKISNRALEPEYERLRNYRYKEIGGYYCSPNLDIVVDGDELAISENGIQTLVTVPPTSGLTPEFVSGSIMGDMSVFAYHHGFVSDFKVQCIETKTGDLCWENNAWSVFTIGFSSGSGGFHNVAFRRSGDLIWLYGVNWLGFYCQAHNSENGKVVARFYTAFFAEKTK